LRKNHHIYADFAQAVLDWFGKVEFTRRLSLDRVDLGHGLDFGFAPDMKSKQQI